MGKKSSVFFIACMLVSIAGGIYVIVEDCRQDERMQKALVESQRAQDELLETYSKNTRTMEDIIYRMRRGSGQVHF